MSENNEAEGISLEEFNEYMNKNNIIREIEEERIRKREEKAEKIRNMRRQGHSIQEIMKVTGLDEYNVISYLDENASEISKYDYFQKDNILAEKGINKNIVFEAYVTFLKKAIIELMTRDLSKMPEKEIIKLVIQIQKILRDDLLAHNNIKIEYTYDDENGNNNKIERCLNIIKRRTED
jgi:hypothetical protein